LVKLHLVLITVAAEVAEVRNLLAELQARVGTRLVHLVSAVTGEAILTVAVAAVVATSAVAAEQLMAAAGALRTPVQH
jgi:hypothetical protein